MFRKNRQCRLRLSIAEASFTLHSACTAVSELICKHTESALGWGEMLNDLYERGVSKIGLICADGLKGLDDVISEVFPGTSLQRCITHLKRNILSDVRNGDKGDVADDLRQVFRTETGTIPWNRPGMSGSSSVLNGAGITEVSGDAVRMLPTRRISLT